MFAHLFSGMVSSKASPQDRQHNYSELSVMAGQNLQCMPDGVQLVIEHVGTVQVAIYDGIHIIFSIQYSKFNMI